LHIKKETSNLKFHVLACDSDAPSALNAIVRPSECLSVTRVDQSKTVEDRIVQFSPYISPYL